MKTTKLLMSRGLILLAMILISPSLIADTVIGTGNNESTSLPIEPYYGYSYTQSIYLSTEVNASGNITGIKWYWSGTSNGANSDSITIYLAHTTKTSFASDTDYVAAANIAPYFTGTVTYPTSPGWMTITLDSSFNYNGTDNLLIAVEEDRPGYNSFGDDFYCTSVSASRSIGFYSDLYNPSITNPHPNLFNRFITAFIPNVTLVGITPACPNPIVDSICYASTNSVDIYWTGTAANYLFEYGAVGFTPGTGTSSTVSAATTSLTGLTNGTSYEYYIQGVCGPGDSSGIVGPLTFTTPCAAAAMPFIDSVENQTASTSGIVSNCYISDPTSTTSSFRWNVTGTGTTLSSFTGALNANSGSKYFFTEASSGSLGDEAYLYLPPIDMGTSTQNILSFYYHMYGASMGTLYIERYDNCSWVVVDSISGQQQTVQSDPWLQKVVPLAYMGEQQIRFRGVKGSSYTGDICIDDINFLNVPSCATIPPHILTADDSIACVNQVVNFSLDTNLSSSVAGISYEWYSSTDGITYSPIAGASAVSYSATITGPTYFQAIIRCSVSGDSAVTSPVFIDIDTFTNCYCTSAANFGGDTDIGQFTIGSFMNPTTTPTPQSSNLTATNTYSDFKSLGAQVVNSTVAQPITVYQITQFGTFYNAYAAVYIDYNQDGVFDPSTELLIDGPTNAGNGYSFTGAAAIPATAMAGVTGMRVVLSEGASSTNIDPCGSYSYGETEDYLIDIVHPPACTGTPVAGNATVTDSMVCPNEVYTLGLDTMLSFSGLSYQWQVSTTSSTAGFTDIMNATNSNFDTSQVQDTWYRCIVECTTSSSMDTSAVVAVYMDSFYGCYCVSTANFSGDDDIGQVTIGSFVNPTTTPSPQAGNPASIEVYTDYTGLGPIPITPGLPTSVSVFQINSSTFQYDCFAAIYIDMNQDGMYDTLAERVFAGSSDVTNNYNPIGFLTVPTTAMTGVTGMRVVLREFGDSSTTFPCGDYGYGETEDYLVNISCAASLNDLPDTTVCAEPGITLDAGAGFVTYSWSTGDSMQTLEVNSTGTYTVSAWDSVGCIDQETVMITANPNPTPMLGADTSFCDGSTVNLSYMDSSIAAWTWSTGDSMDNIDATAGGNYWLTVTDMNGCMGTDSVMLTSISLPTVSTIVATQSTTNQLEYSFSSNGSNANTYSWDFGDGNTDNTSQPKNTYGVSDNYTVTLIVSNDCGSDTATLTQWFGIPESINTPSSEIFKLYPNPTKDFITLELLSTVEMNSLQLVNSIGQRIDVQSESIGTGKYKITFPEIPTGNYYLEIQTDEGSFGQTFLLTK